MRSFSKTLTETAWRGGGASKLRRFPYKWFSILAPESPQNKKETSRSETPTYQPQPKVPTKADLKQQPLDEGKLHAFVVSDAPSADQLSVQIDCPQTRTNLEVIQLKLNEHFENYTGEYTWTVAL